MCLKRTTTSWCDRTQITDAKLDTALTCAHTNGRSFKSHVYRHGNTFFFTYIFLYVLPVPTQVIVFLSNYQKQFDGTRVKKQKQLRSEHCWQEVNKVWQLFCISGAMTKDSIYLLGTPWLPVLLYPPVFPTPPVWPVPTPPPTPPPIPPAASRNIIISKSSHYMWLGVPEQEHIVKIVRFGGAIAQQPTFFSAYPRMRLHILIQLHVLLTLQHATLDYFVQQCTVRRSRNC